MKALLIAMLIPAAVLAAEAPEGMVLIPAGEYEMGREGSVDASPPHAVKVGAFYLDVRELSNAEYKVFCDSTGHRLPFFWGMERFRSGEDFPDDPVVGVSHYDAREYAAWAGKRLPSEAEWEWAARGGLEGQPYPNGEAISAETVNYGNTGASTPVGSFEPNGYGLYDMAGNAWELVQDFYDADYYESSPVEDPRGPESGTMIVIRGGSWHSGPGCVRVDRRGTISSGWLDFAVGFRCARDLETAED